MVQGSRFRVQGSGFRVHGSGFRVQGSWFRVQGSECWVQGSGFGIRGARFGAGGSTLRFLDLEKKVGLMGHVGKCTIEVFVCRMQGCRLGVKGLGFRV
jgi:hypothetical protein